jgi:hypothetical protein
MLSRQAANNGPHAACSWKPVLSIFRPRPILSLIWRTIRCVLAHLHLDTGTIEPLKQAAGDAPEFFSPQNAIFSPDGSKLLYTYRDARITTRLVVRDLSGGAEQLLLSRPGKAIGASDFGQGLNWSADDTVYAATGPGIGLLLRLAGL